MSDIEFTQYLMPHGHRTTVRIDRPEHIVAKANKLRERGYRFECEMLSDYQSISLTITNDDGDAAIEVVSNGPKVPEAIDRMIMEFQP